MVITGKMGVAIRSRSCIADPTAGSIEFLGGLTDVGIPDVGQGSRRKQTHDQEGNPKPSCAPEMKKSLIREVAIEVKGTNKLLALGDVTHAETRNDHRGVR